MSPCRGSEPRHAQIPGRILKLSWLGKQLKSLLALLKGNLYSLRPLSFPSAVGMDLQPWLWQILIAD